jgi:hypothetical protein
MGWTDRTVLQASFAQCINSSDCPIDTAGSVDGNNVQGSQPLIYAAPIEDIGLNGSEIALLPGNNPVSWNGNQIVKVKIYSSDGNYWVSPGQTGAVTVRIFSCK